MAAHSTVTEILRREVPDWDDEVLSLARFKAFTGQRPDWEQRYLFWRNLILTIARSLDLCTLNISEVRNVWFVRGGLTPLCIDHVLLEMYSAGDIILRRQLMDPTSGTLIRMIKSFASLVGFFNIQINEKEDYIILKALVQEKADGIIKHLSESHWSSHSVITMEKFRNTCKGSEEAYAVLSYLTQYRKAQYFSLRNVDPIEGVKISLTQAPVAGISSLDFDVLQLLWTIERLQQQLETIEKWWLTSRKMAVVSLKSGNKTAAYRYGRQMKMFTERRKKCTSYLERVQEVLSLIFDAETTRKVSEAIQIGARAMKENKISLEEVQKNLLELEECITSQKEVKNALGHQEDTTRCVTLRQSPSVSVTGSREPKIYLHEALKRPPDLRTMCIGETVRVLIAKHQNSNCSYILVDVVADVAKKKTGKISMLDHKVSKIQISTYRPAERSVLFIFF